MEQIDREAIASEIERLENVLQFVRFVGEAIDLAHDIGPGGFAEQIGYKNFMGFSDADHTPPLTLKEERFMNMGLHAAGYHWRVRQAIHVPFILGDSILAASRGVFQVGKKKCPSAISGAFRFFFFWSMANTANCFERWHREKNLNPAEQPAGVNLTPPRAKYLQCRWYIAHLKHELAPFDLEAIHAAGQLELAAIKRERQSTPSTPADTRKKNRKKNGFGTRSVRTR